MSLRPSRSALRQLRSIIAIVAGCSTPAWAQDAVAITHVSVIDGTTATPRADQTVLIRGNRIASVRPSRGTPTPSATRVVDGRGSSSCPGSGTCTCTPRSLAGRELLVALCGERRDRRARHGGRLAHAQGVARRDRRGTARRPTDRSRQARTSRAATCRSRTCSPATRPRGARVSTRSRRSASISSRCTASSRATTYFAIARRARETWHCVRRTRARARSDRRPRPTRDRGASSTCSRFRRRARPRSRSRSSRDSPCRAR